MGNYLKKIERDYIDGKISLDEKENLKKEYESSSKKYQKECDERVKIDGKGNFYVVGLDEKNKTKSTKSKPPRFVNYKEERNAFWRSKYPTSKILFRIIEVVNIIALIILGILILLLFVEDLGFLGFPAILATGFSVVTFYLFKEMLLFQVDKNYFEYKQAEKYLK